MTTTPDTADTADTDAPGSDTVSDQDGTDSRTAYPYILPGVDPRTLRAQGNSREVGDIRQTRPELVASIAEHGMDPKISIINVAPDPDGVLRVLVGHHRTAAAVAVKEQENPDLTVDVLVHAPGTRLDVLVAQGLENMQRVGYTTVEEAGLFEQLALEGLDVETIAQKLVVPDEHVQAGLTVAASARTRAAGKTLPTADLFLLSQLAEFGDDEDAHRTLVDVLAHRPHQFQWTLDRLRDERKQQDLLARETQRFTDLGYALVDDEDDLPDGAERLDGLCAVDDDVPLDPAGHADCPGRAVSVWVDRDLEVEVLHFCRDYTAHGHRTLASVRIAQTQERLRAEGVPIVDPDTEGVIHLSQLLAHEQARDPLTAEDHAGCPGHAAYVIDVPFRSTTDIGYVCTDYRAHGHVRRFASTAQPEPERDAAYQAGERKRASTNNKLWRNAKIDRRKWLTQYFTGWRKRKASELPTRLQHWLALAPVLAYDHLAEAAHAHAHACALLKLAEPQDHHRTNNPIAVLLRRKTTTDTQAILIRLAQVIGACEAHWNAKYTDNADASWRSPSDDTRFYLELLQALGYPLSHVEQLVNNPALDHEKWPHLTPADEQTSDEPAADQPPA
ncbi:ParB/RepB/Spo0J family partition protein [Saccharothrix xinjiangensis]|uniref:ParB/RepB/Spo0J family partition protein n=1 Tax=Saccharothrix xinjiangensis TaxID=204798 RepID=A0ABV9XVZ8_9PSEU